MATGSDYSFLDDFTHRAEALLLAERRSPEITLQERLLRGRLFADLFSAADPARPGRNVQVTPLGGGLGSAALSVPGAGTANVLAAELVNGTDGRLTDVAAARMQRNGGVRLDSL